MMPEEFLHMFWFQVEGRKEVFVAGEQFSADIQPDRTAQIEIHQDQLMKAKTCPSNVAFRIQVPSAASSAFLLTC